MHKRQYSKLTKTEKNHRLQREIFHQFRSCGAISPEYYDDRYSLDEMLQILIDTIQDDMTVEHLSKRQRKG